METVQNRARKTPTASPGRNAATRGFVLCVRDSAAVQQTAVPLISMIAIRNPTNAFSKRDFVQQMPTVKGGNSATLCLANARLGQGSVAQTSIVREAGSIAVRRHTRASH